MAEEPRRRGHDSLELDIDQVSSLILVAGMLALPFFGKLMYDMEQKN